jgi:sugar phosphate isomerase/epimerase
MFKYCAKRKTEDVSIHPGLLANVSLNSSNLPDKSPEYRSESKECLKRLLVMWLPRFLDQGITLSLETHVTSAYFVFQGISDFQDFVLGVPGLGEFADISHNSFDCYAVAGLLKYFQPLSITGFHLSDAATEKGFPDGTHLPIGKGHFDFISLISGYKRDNKIYGALEVRGSAQAISDSLAGLRRIE